MQPSTVQAFFDGKPYDDWTKRREAELKVQTGIADRLNNVVRAIGVLNKTIARSR
jgi:hypothetical protein